ncbi:hypothetical protein BKA69DRAFT_1122143 [Paraphysoderma sedebokerense]|nr:hypothetical protein BKA69DRAFT_1122143 [Paraphysoderma sedebokerense]
MDTDTDDVVLRESNSELQTRIDSMILLNRQRIDESNQREFVDQEYSQQMQIGDENEPLCSRVHPANIDRTVQMKRAVVNNTAASLIRSTYGAGSLAYRNYGNNMMQRELQKLHQQGKLVVPDGLNDVEEGLKERVKNLMNYLGIKFALSKTQTLNITERFEVLLNRLNEIEEEYAVWVQHNIPVLGEEYLQHAILRRLTSGDDDSDLSAKPHHIIKQLENRIIEIESKYPLWAALNFYTPNRPSSLPPPPSTTVSKSSHLLPNPENGIDKPIQKGNFVYQRTNHVPLYIKFSE